MGRGCFQPIEIIAQIQGDRHGVAPSIVDDIDARHRVLPLPVEPWQGIRQHVEPMAAGQAMARAGQGVEPSSGGRQGMASSGGRAGATAGGRA
jgi:hypothetical protein